MTGPTAGTRMACPEAPSAVEARFLVQLGAVRRFAFMLGRLALSYQSADGGAGTMLFASRTRPTPPTPRGP